MTDHVGVGFADRLLVEDEVKVVLEESVQSWDLDGKKVLLLIPDHTRTCPLSTVFPLLYDLLAPRVQHLTVMVALGTHSPMEEEDILSLVGVSPSDLQDRFEKASFVNHMWKDQECLTEVGQLRKSEVGELTDGLFEMDVSVTCNKAVVEHDDIIILGPVFPHEVVGFSGGNKYIVPGISGQEIIDFFHWLGAVITNPMIIGNKWTPVRKIVDRVAAMVPARRHALCMVTTHDGLAGLYGGEPEKAWEVAADLSAEIHITYKRHAYHTVLSCAPEMYDDLWTGGKCMYKVEPVVADGGRVIIYAPHITQISDVHGAVLHEIGYHTRDFFLAQWDKYKDYPWGVVAHSTHVKGIGTYEDGVEKPRAEVILATGITKDICDRVNLGYMDHHTIDVSEFEGREEEGILYVPDAGEMLHRLRNA